MLGKILGSGQLGKLASFVSPAFFDVMPARALLRRAKGLLADSRDTAKVQRVVAQRTAELTTLMPELQLREPSANDAIPPGAARAEGVAPWQGALVAELYFRQLFMRGSTLLDLRATSFTTDGTILIWSPTTWLADFSPDFIGPLRDLYVGFYQHDDARFRHALAQLNLSHSEDLFREQFGEGQDKVLFNVRAFIDVFHRVFERCKQAQTALHPDFLPLGIYLAALYDHEQELGVPIDVASAFAKATKDWSPDLVERGQSAGARESNHA